MELSAHLGLLAEPVRVRLLAVIEREELGVGELCRVLQLPQSTVSRHLKALRVAGWVARRAEGTAGLVRLDAEAVPEPARRVWEVVRAEHELTHQAAEDEARLVQLLEERRADASTFFGRMVARWDDLRAELFGTEAQLPTLLALLPPDLVVGDLGCGTGQTLVQLAPVVGRVVGIDREQGMLDAAAVRVGHLPNVELRRGDLHDLPLHGASLDAAFAMLVLHHDQAPVATFREAARVLRPGGLLILLDMRAHDRVDWQHTMGHVHLGFTEPAIREWAGEAGLALRSWRDLPPAADAIGPPLFVAVLVRPAGRGA